MNISSTFGRISLLTATLGLLAIASCGHPSTGSDGSGGSTGAGGNCTPGEELCSCMAGNACNPGLACADHINKCVMIGSTGSGGSSATGGTTGTGGGSTGGALGTGGTIGSGGSAGGSATGGRTGTGGGSASGGTTGSGGSMANCAAGSASSGTNLVMNGDLSQGDMGWNVGQGNPSSSGVMNGQYCATFNSGTVLLGWGNGSIAANLMSGASYRLSYQVSSTNGSGTTLEIHVGQAVSPYNSDIAQPIKPMTGCDLQSSPTTFAQTFMSTASDSTAGIAFLFTTNSNTTVCIDNVTLTQN